MKRTTLLFSAVLAAAPFLYLRVDLYNAGGQVFFGEMTFTPEEGRDPWWPRSWERRFGEMIALPDER
jgi:hypothetical protein